MTSEVTKKESGWPFGGRRKPHRLWALWKDGCLNECEVNEHPLGHELRFYYLGELQYTHVLRTRELAESEAEERKREMIAEGWTDRPPMSD